ncbi:hypothetical protein ASD53_19390 [Lysobacter sp. Root559]|nr:hypothetical protein ASD53_19390 [Lysobacter sp. Root559]KRC31435.1 hypothetical protein ASE10_16980 [Lysobacter sp. Root76]
MNGGLRDYSSYCYIVHMDDGCSVDEAVRHYYQWLPQLRFFSVKRLGGVRDLENLLGHYLVRDSPKISQGDLLDLRHHLSFKVMDMMSVVFERLDQLEVFELLAESSPHSSESVFYSVCAEDLAVVLQFNEEESRTPTVPH